MSGLLDVAKDAAGSAASNKISFPHLQKTLFDGTFTISGESLTGIYHGFHISIVWLDRHTFTPQYVVTINASNPNDPGNNNLKDGLFNLYKDKKRASLVEVSDYTATLSYVRTALTGEFGALASDKAKNELEEFINATIDYLEENSYTSTCVDCGAQGGCKVYDVDGTPMMLCDSCFQEQSIRFAKNQVEKKSKESSTSLGIVGAVIGAAIGAAVWCFIYHLGFVSAIGGIAIVFFAFKGCELLGKGRNKKCVIISMVVSILFVYLAWRIGASYDLFTFLITYGEISFPDVFFNLELLLDALEMPELFTEDLINGYIFAAVSCIPMIRSNLKVATGSYKIEEITFS